MPKHYVLTDAGLKPDDGTSQVQNVEPIDSRTLAPEVQVTPSAPASSSQTFDLRAVAREVQALGALHLDKKRDAKSFKEAQLSKLGVKLPSKPRLSAKIGLGAHKKGRLLDEQREQDLIDSGMKSLRGRAKRKAASQKKTPKDKGLNEAKGYKAGLMHVKPAALKSSGARRRGQPHKLGNGRGKNK